jgi:hypothetical protein
MEKIETIIVSDIDSRKINNQYFYYLFLISNNKNMNSNSIEIALNGHSKNHQLLKKCNQLISNIWKQVSIR